MRGDLIVNLSTDRLERVEVGARLLIRECWYTVTSSRLQGSKRVVHLEGVDDRDAAFDVDSKGIARAQHRLGHGRGVTWEKDALRAQPLGFCDEF